MVSSGAGSIGTLIPTVGSAAAAVSGVYSLSFFFFFCFFFFSILFSIIEFIETWRHL